MKTCKNVFQLALVDSNISNSITSKEAAQICCILNKTSSIMSFYCVCAISGRVRPDSHVKEYVCKRQACAVAVHHLCKIVAQHLAVC